MTLEEIKQYLRDRGGEGTIVLEDPDYASAVIGISEDERLIYSFDKMVEHLKEVDGMSEEDAVDFIQYNTIRSLPYMGSHAPVILYTME